MDEQTTTDAPDHPDGRITHGGYRFNYSKQYTLDKIPKHLPSYLGNASVVSFKCSQYRYRPSGAPKYPNELDKQRHREAMSTHDYHGTINVYFPPKPRRTFNHRNEAVDVMITVRHDHHLGRGESGVPVSNFNKELDKGKSSFQLCTSTR